MEIIQPVLKDLMNIIHLQVHYKRIVLLWKKYGQMDNTYILLNLIHIHLVPMKEEHLVMDTICSIKTQTINGLI